jgi:glycosyltransferase EpsF
MSTTSPIKVLHVLHSLSMGGAETWLMELLRYWAQTGAVEMHFLATSGHRGIFDDEVEGLGGKIHYLRYGRDNLVEFVRGYRSLLVHEDFSAIHDHGDLTSGWHFLLGVGCLPPVRVAHVHNPFSHLYANYAVTHLRRMTSYLGRLLVKSLATDVCGTSSKSLIEYSFRQQLGGPDISTLHCGFDINKFNSPRAEDHLSVLKEFGFPRRSQIVLFAGRLDRDLEIANPRNHKNSWLALLICRIAAERAPHLRLVMAGAGDEQRLQLEQRIAEWGLSDRLRLVGVRKDMARLMRAADILLFPSREEGLGMVAVEAQAAGTPVLASSAIPEEAVIVPSMFHRMDLTASPEAWADKLCKLLKEPRPEPGTLLEVLEKSAFSIRNSAARLETIYRDEKGKADISLQNF